MFTQHSTRIAVSYSIAAALAVAGVWIGLHAQGVDGRTIVGLALLGAAAAWIVQVHLVARSAAERV